MTKVIAMTLLAVSLCTVAASQLLFKYAFSRHDWQLAAGETWFTLGWRLMLNPAVWAGAILVLVGVVCWYLAMIRLPLSLMLPMAGIIAPVVSVAAYFLLGEILTPAKFAAILLIAGGVAWLGLLNA
jgi:drug/metabolite transporter (DMT)-like permease